MPVNQYQMRQQLAETLVALHDLLLGDREYVRLETGYTGKTIKLSNSCWKMEERITWKDGLIYDPNNKEYPYCIYVDGKPKYLVLTKDRKEAIDLYEKTQRIGPATAG